MEKGSLFWIALFAGLLSVISQSAAGECFRNHDCGKASKQQSDLLTCLMNTTWRCHPDQFCRVEVNHDIHFHCQDTLDHYQECIDRSSMQSQLCNVKLGDQPGEIEHHCRFCCNDSSCVLQLAKSGPGTTAVPTTTPTTTRTTTATTTPTATTPTTTTPTTTTEMLQNFLHQDCQDLVNCTAGGCYGKLAPTMCRKFCDLCDYPLLVLDPAVPTLHPPPPTQAPTTKPTRQTTSTATTTTFAAIPIPRCVDTFPDCATTPHICHSPYAGDICQRFCGLCPSTQPPPVVTAPSARGLTNTGCVDYISPEKCKIIPHICLSPYAPQTCPRHCGICWCSTLIITVPGANSPDERTWKFNTIKKI